MGVVQKFSPRALSARTIQPPFFIFLATALDSVLVRPSVENQLLVTHAKLIAQLEKEIDDYPEHVCVSCQCLYQRKSVTKSDNLSSNVWPRIKHYVLGQNPNAVKDETLYMCNYCKTFTKF